MVAKYRWYTYNIRKYNSFLKKMKENEIEKER